MEKDRDIFLSILDRHKGILYKIANTYCKESKDRPDLMQEIIIQLWVSFDNYDDQFKWSTWIYRIALNTAISYYRKNKSRKEYTVELSPIFENSIKASSSTEENPEMVWLQRFIQELKELDRALILLHLDGVGNQEIAKIIGISPSNVSTKLGRIKQILKKKFTSR